MVCPRGSTPASRPASGKRWMPSSSRPSLMAIPEADRIKLRDGANTLGEELTVCSRSLANPAHMELLPDVQVIHKAVDWAVRYNEFIDIKDVAAAKALLELGKKRIAELIA